MAPHPPFNPVLIGTDWGSGDNTAIIRATCTTCNGLGYLIIHDSNRFTDTTSNFSWEDHVPKITPRLLRGFAKYLSDAEKALLRAINYEPTMDGVKSCREHHDRIPIVLRSYSNRTHFHFDRRIPCWRAGRWKSLT